MVRKLAAGLLLPLIALPVAAQDLAIAPYYPSDFRTCDGYATPENGQDGIDQPHGTAEGIDIGIGPDIGRGEPVNNNRNFSSLLTRFTPHGVNACTRALAQANMLPASYHLRRASLLQARGLHHLNDSANQQALDDLLAAAAEAGQITDPLIARSLGVSNRMFSARALIRLDRQPEALALLEEARALRPYSSQVAVALARFEYRLNRDMQAYQRRLQQLSTQHPQMRLRLYDVALLNQDWEAAIATRAEIDYAPPEYFFAGYRRQNYANELLALFLLQSSHDVTEAIVLALLNRDVEAASRVAALQARIETTRAELPRDANGRRGTRNERELHELQQGVLPQLEQLLQVVQGQLELVALARAGDATSFAAHPAREHSATAPLNRAILQLLAANTTDAAARSTTEAAIAALPVEENGGFEELEPMDLNFIYDAMPGPETLRNMPRYNDGRSFLGEINAQGYISQDFGPLTRVNVGAQFASAAVVEEMALLRAAQIALERGQPTFVLVAKDVTRRSLSTVPFYYGAAIATDIGYAAAVTMAGIGPEGLPPEYAALDDRRIDAAQVVADLGPLYIREED